MRFASLAVVPVVLGFRPLPSFLDNHLIHDTAELGPFALVFMFWVFINIHRHVIDNASDGGKSPRWRGSP